MKRRSVVLGVAGVLLIAVSCGDDPTGPELVTIAGIVRNVDTGQPAPGARVRLWGSSYADQVATGSDGAYILSVPRGSNLLLFTDDFDPNTADEWFPLINVDLAGVIANQDMLDWPIHTCPQTACPPDSFNAVAVWDNYLMNVDGRTGDRFVPTSSAASGGILAIGFGEAVGSAYAALDSMSVTVSTPAFPSGWVDPTIYSSSQLCRPDAPSFYQASTYDHGSTFISFGDTSYTGQTVTLQLADLSTRHLAFKTPAEVPVAPGTISLCFTGAVDGVPNRTFRDVNCAAGTFMCSP